MIERKTLRERQEDRFRKVFALVLVTLFSVLFARMIAPFFEALLLAIVFSGLLYPVFDRLRRRFLNRVLASALVTLLVLLAIVLPLTFVVAAFTRQALRLSQSLAPWLEQQAESASVAFEWPAWLPFTEQIPVDTVLTRAAAALSNTGELLVDGLGSVTQTTLVFVIQLGVMLYTLFYLLLTGPRLMHVFDYTPLTETDRRLVADRGMSITRATLKGTVVIGILQGTLAAIAFAVVGLPAPIFWGVIMTILSAIPGIGAALVWVPAVVYLFVTGAHVEAIGLGLWCTLIVSTVDNLVRPWLVGSDSQMPAVLVLLSTLGGIVMFGIGGIIIGPLLAGFFLTSWHVFAAAFQRELSDAETAPPLADSTPGATDEIIVAEDVPAPVTDDDRARRANAE